MNSFTTVLSRVPTEDRTRFLEDMAFVNGKLVNINLGAILRSLTEDEVQTLMEECGCTTKDARCSGTAG